MNCKQCALPYNNGKNVPQLLPRCGHTVCSACLQLDFASGRYKCLECSVVNFAEIIDDFPKNLTLLSISSPHKVSKNYSEPSRKVIKRDNYSDNISLNRDDISSMGKCGINFFSVDNLDNICLFHKKPIEAYCIDEKMLLCVQCLIDKTHHDHKVTDISKAYDKVKQTVYKRLDDFGDYSDVLSHGFSARINESVRDISTQYSHAIDKVGMQFRELKDIIARRQREVESALELVKKS